jgi:hypothetical protein
VVSVVLSALSRGTPWNCMDRETDLGGGGARLTGSSRAVAGVKAGAARAGTLLPPRLSVAPLTCTSRQCKNSQKVLVKRASTTTSLAVRLLILGLPGSPPDGPRRQGVRRQCQADAV